MKLQADELHKNREKVIEGFSMACGGFLQAGKHLTIIKQKKLWELDGTHSKNFEQWVKGELGYSKSTAYNAMAVYEKFGDLIEHDKAYKRLDFSHIVALLPYCNEKTPLEEKEKLLNLLEGQTVEGVKNQLRELKGLKPSDGECDHSWRTVEVCEKCNKWRQT
jgi:hypothetical protein